MRIHPRRSPELPAPTRSETERTSKSLPFHPPPNTRTHKKAKRKIADNTPDSSSSLVSEPGTAAVSGGAVFWSPSFSFCPSFLIGFCGATGNGYAYTSATRGDPSANGDRSGRSCSGSGDSWCGDCWRRGVHDADAYPCWVRGTSVTAAYGAGAVRRALVAAGGRAGGSCLCAAARLTLCPDVMRIQGGRLKKRR
jgi:hypothetical protein